MEREPRPPEPPLELTHDYRYAYRGYHTDGGVCRVRIFEGEGQVPVVIVTQLPENTNTSITNMAEYLAAEIIARHFPARFEADEPAVQWIEHYPRTATELRRGMPAFALVEFASYRPRRVPRFGRDRVAIGRPSWRYVAQDAVERLVGRPLTDAGDAARP